MCFSIFTETFCLAAKLGCDGCVLFCKDLSAVVPKHKLIKISYISIMIFSIILIIFLTSLGINYLSTWKYYIHCNDESGGDLNCLGISALYRTCFSLFFLHLAVLCVCLLKNKLSEIINESCWFIKFLLFMIILYSSLYVPNTFFQMYAEVAKIIGIAFILFQIIMMIDLFYLWGEKWVENYNNSGTFWSFAIIVTTIALYLSSFFLNIQSFDWFDSKSSFNSFVLILNLFLIVIISLTSISGIARNGSLLTSGGVSLYGTFLLWSGLSNSDKENNYFYRSSTPLNVQIFIGCITIVFSLFYVSLDQNYLGEKRNTENNDNYLEIKRDEEIGIISSESYEKDKKNLENNYNVYTDSNVYVHFHLIMIISTFFIAMLFTNWGAPNLNQPILYSYYPNIINYWVQIISSWTLIGLYLWSLVAPHILKNREFD